MRILAFATLTLLLPIGGLAQKPVQVGKEYGLKSLSSLSVIVEEMGTREKEIQLDGATLKSQAVVAVKRNIPKISISDDADTYIYVNVLCVAAGAGVACETNVSLRRHVMVVDDGLKPIGYTYGEVWHKGSILAGPLGSMAGRIRQSVDEQLTEFAADYYQANP